MRVMMVGVNHRTAPVELREKLALNGPRLVDAIRGLSARHPGAEVVVVSTCNRTEVYLARPSHEPPRVDQVVGFLAEVSGLACQRITQASIHLENQAAVRHLFRVACGLESMVLGEPQVLGQVKRAYQVAVDAGSVGQALHRVFQQATAVAKRVRTETQIGAGRVSVGSVAVDFARQIFERFDDKTIIGIGAGQLAKPTLFHLKQLNPAKLWVANRSHAKAQTLAESLGLGQHSGGGARRFEDLDSLLVEADIALASTGAAHPFITVDRFKPLLRRRRLRPLFLIDIAVPRNVEPAVGKLHNVYLYNIDDLQRVVEQTHSLRAGQVEACESILDEAVVGCVDQIQTQDIGQLVRVLRERLHTIGDHEQQRTVRKLATTPQADWQRVLPELIAEHTRRLINKVLHLPLSQLDHRQAGPGRGFYAAALRHLFGLNEDPPPDQGDETLPASSSEDPDSAAATASEIAKATRLLKQAQESVWLSGNSLRAGPHHNKPDL